jgi:NAD-dependent SIR2 family protein deacetylase
MKNAIFLGAGASKAEGAPLQNELFRDYFKYLRLNYRADDMTAELRTFFFQIFGIDVDCLDLDKIDFPTFEEVLGILDLAEMNGESLIDFTLENRGKNSDRLRMVKVYLILLMAEIISKGLEQYKKIHERLVNNLNSKNLLKKTFFITTNYDILIDNAIARLSVLDGGNAGEFVDYGIELTNFDREKDWHKPTDRATKLFKIHGSLNWLYCNVCKTITCTPFEKGVIRLINNDSNALCKNCKSQLIPIIIPPTYFKKMDNVYLAQIWNNLEQSLRKVENIIFCGYSFPDSDIHIKYLLKRIQTNRDLDKVQKITVINNHPGKIQNIKDEERIRYTRFLGEDLNYTDKSFEDFANNPELFVR